MAFLIFLRCKEGKKKDALLYYAQLLHRRIHKI